MIPFGTVLMALAIFLAIMIAIASFGLPQKMTEREKRGAVFLGFASAILFLIGVMFPQ